MANAGAESDCHLYRQLVPETRLTEGKSVLTLLLTLPIQQSIASVDPRLPLLPDQVCVLVPTDSERLVPSSLLEKTQECRCLLDSLPLRQWVKQPQEIQAGQVVCRSLLLLLPLSSPSSLTV